MEPLQDIRLDRAARRGLRAAAALLLALVATCAVMGASAPDDRSLPAIVFVSRDPLPGGAGVPGIGPLARAAITRGRLMVRERSGGVRELVPHARFRDVADPAVSWDGTRVAFAAVEHPDSAWRIWAVGADGRALARVTRTDRALDLSAWGEAAAPFARYDDIDPAWLPDGRVVFASTRFPMRGQDGGAVTNLFVVAADGGALHRITTERNGAEEPSVDPASGRILYTRRWFNRMLASERDTSGITTERARAVPADPVDLWQAISVLQDGDGMRLAGGNPRDRTQLMAYQPIALADGALVGVRAASPSLMPAPGAMTVVSFPAGVGAEVPLVGAGTAAGGSACAPAALPGDRIVFAWDPRGRGDFGLWTIERGGKPRRLHDAGRSLELDPAPIVAREMPPPLPPENDVVIRDLPFATLAELGENQHIVRFDCANAFANGDVDSPFPDAVPPERGVRIRFFAALNRPAGAGGDTIVLVHEAPVTAQGEIGVDRIPADIPLFEQLVSRDGRVLRSAMGPAHVPGFNFGRPGAGTKCVGCHVGHSAQSVGINVSEASWTNLSPSARASASASRPGTAGPRGAVDRRVRAPVDSAAWVGAGPDDFLALAWNSSIEVAAVVLYAVPADPRSETDLGVRSCSLAFFLRGQPVGEEHVSAPLTPQGIRVDLSRVHLDSLVVRPVRAAGRVKGQETVALAEVETIARLPDE
jgi:WD40-like Beta Propeller Repeat